MSDLPYSPINVGNRLRLIRKAHGLSQHKFAQRAGVNPSSVGNWELGQSRPGLGSAMGIIDAFDLTLDYLFFDRMATLRHSVAMRLMEGEAD